MVQVHSAHRLDQIEIALRMAAERHGGAVLAITNIGQLLHSEHAAAAADAVSMTVCFPEMYSALLNAEVRFAAFLPSRVAVCSLGGGTMLETISVREICRLLHRPDLEPQAAALEETLRTVMEEAAGPHARVAAAAAGAGEHRATEDQVNMRAALPQRIDCRGTKVEELAGTGVHDAQGG